VHVFGAFVTDINGIPILRSAVSVGLISVVRMSAKFPSSAALELTLQI